MYFKQTAMIDLGYTAGKQLGYAAGSGLLLSRQHAGMVWLQRS